MRDAGIVADIIISRFRSHGGAQGKQNFFGYAGNQGNGFLVLRNNGSVYAVDRDFVIQAVEAVRKEPAIYSAGPARLKPYIIRWIYSPLWAMLQLASLDEIQS